MANVVVEPVASPLSGGMGALNGIFQFISKSWKFILIGALIAILGIVIISLINKLSEERKERDSAGYALYKATRRTCVLRKKGNWIRQKYALSNLLLLGLPIHKQEQSVKIMDRYGHLIGWYRGDFQSQDQCWNLLLYREKIFILFEQTFLLKVPMVLTFKTLKASGIEKEKKKQDLTDDDYEEKSLDLSKYIKTLNDGNIQINCVDIERVGTYYYCPVYPYSPAEDSNPVKIDYRKIIEGAIIDNTYQIMTQRVLDTSVRQIDRMAYINPNIQAGQKMPEQTKEERMMEGGR